MSNILFVNACLRSGSRTRELADYLLTKLSGEITELKLDERNSAPLYADTLLKRESMTAHSEFDHKIFDNAWQLKEADIVVIAAPCYDLSFPAILKAYLESLCVPGITFSYTPEGIPRSLCRVKKVYYITTAGGRILNDEYGYGYIRSLFENLFGVHRFSYIKAEDLDIDGADVKGILKEAKTQIDAISEV